MKRFSLTALRRLHTQPTPFPRFPAYGPTMNSRRGNLSTSLPRAGGVGATSSFDDEAWTQYDYAGAAPHAHNPRTQRDWRAREAALGGGGSSKSRGGNRDHPRGGPPIPPPASKRTKQTPRRVARSPRRGALASEELMDELYLQRTFGEPPRREDYPKAPSTLFENPKGFLWDNKDLLSSSTFGSLGRNGTCRCTVLVVLPDETQVEAVGESGGKKQAEKVACMHAILKMHQAGQLAQLITGSIPKVGQKALLEEEQDAKMDIYDYCARFDTTPSFTAKEVNQSMRGRARRSVIEVIVEMPEQGIRASGKAQDRRTAEILACIEFKRQAEEFHAKHGDEDIVVKDLTALNSRNAKKFFEFVKIHKKSIVYECETRSVKGNKKLSSNMTSASVILNDEPLGESVEMVGKKLAESGAWLAGAVALKKMYPEIFPQFVEALRIGKGEILKPVNPNWFNVDQNTQLAMTDTLLSVRRIGLPRSEEELEAEEEEDEKKYRRPPPRRRLDPALAKVKSQKMLKEYEEYLSNPKLETLRSKRAELPMNHYAPKVLDLINQSDVSIVVGATGSGKTTQVPQIVLESAIRAGTGAECNIICTQPRRIAATSVAQRVAVERNESLQKSIGYQVRFDSKLPLAGGSVTYCTTGILLQQLRNSPEETLDGITHLLIDEVHERDIMIDYLLIILRRILKTRKRLGKSPVKIVLMSATMDTELFAGYFRTKHPDGTTTECPSISVPGRTFPVKEFYLEDVREMLQAANTPQQLSLLREDDTRRYLETEENFVPVSRVPSRAPSRAVSATEEDDVDAGAGINWKQEVSVGADGQAIITTEKDDALVPTGLIATTLAHIAKTTADGAILVFLPGLEEIQKVAEIISQHQPLGVDFNDTAKFKVSWLHSSIPNQNEVFEEVPEGCRKIILSTNIAETSVTIPDVKFVIDSGKLREKQYEQLRRITQLVCTWVSKSNSKQRAGRAGRVQDGNYFAMFSRSRFDSLRATGLPEMLRSDLQEICLDIKSQGFSDPIAQFLSEAIEPPAPQVIAASLAQLQTLGALTDKERLTQLGHVLATMPVEPALGKMILLAVIFRCLDPIVILGASAAGRDVFVSPPDRRAEANRAKQSFIRGTGSDHMGLINAFREWRGIRDSEGQFAATRFADTNFLHRGALRTLEQTTRQIEDILVEIGIIPRVRKDQKFKSELGHPRLNDNSGSVPLVKALILAGMYPNLAVCTSGRGFRTMSENFTMIHPSSSHYPKGNDGLLPLGALITYSQKAKSNDGSTILLRQNTESHPLAALLFGGKLRPNGNALEIDSWLPFLTSQMAGRTIIEFRKCLDRLLAHAFQNLSQRGVAGERKYLADDEARETFAMGLVDVLNGDTGRREKSGAGWGGDSYRPRDSSRGRDRSLDRSGGGFDRDFPSFGRRGTPGPSRTPTPAGYDSRDLFPTSRGPSRGPSRAPTPGGYDRDFPNAPLGRDRRSNFGDPSTGKWR